MANPSTENADLPQHARISFTHRAVIFYCLAPIAIAAVAVIIFIIRPPGYITKTSDFKQDMQAHVNPQELQRWAEQEIEQAQGELIKISDIPPFITSTQDGPPQYVHVMPNDGKPYVHLMWGGGFGHWGLKVGRPTFVANDSPSDYHVAWEPGIFVWHEVQ